MFTKENKITAKKNFLALELNYRFVKKLANKSSNSKDFNELHTARAKAFLSGYSHALGSDFEGKIFGAEWIKDNKDDYIISNYQGYIPEKFYMNILNKVYYCIKYNKFEEIEEYYHGYKIAEYLINPETKINYQFNN